MPLPCAPLWFSIPHITQISDTVSKKEAETNWFLPLFGGDKRDRTADLLNAIQALSQLSYTPMFNFCCFADRTSCILAEYYPFVNYFFVFLPIEREEREFFVIWELSAIVDYYKQA